MRPAQTVCALSAALLLVGCASDGRQAKMVEAEAAQGRCAQADALADRAADAGLRSYEHYYVAAVCRKNGDGGLGYLNLSARFGNSAAQSELARLGRPVPTPDLAAIAAREAEANGAIAAAALTGIAGAFRAPVTTTCSSSFGVTNCISQ